MDTFYRERANGHWEYWTYAEGRRVFVTERAALRGVRQGDKLIHVNQEGT